MSRACRLTRVESPGGVSGQSHLLLRLGDFPLVFHHSGAAQFAHAASGPELAVHAMSVDGVYPSRGTIVAQALRSAGRRAVAMAVDDRPIRDGRRSILNAACRALSFFG